MRPVTLAVFLALTPLVARQPTPIVERGRIGSIAIGAEADAIYQEFRDRAKLVDLKLEGMLSPALEVKLFGSQRIPSLVAEIGASDRRLIVTRIQVFDPALKTKDGIGVGSTYGELRATDRVDWVGAGVLTR